MAVVGDEDDRLPGLPHEAFQPEHALQIEMVRRLVEEQRVRLVRQGAGDREPLAPTAAERRCVLFQIGETELSQRDLGPGCRVGAVVVLLAQVADDLGDGCGALGELVVLRDVPQAQALLPGDLALVRLLDPDEDLEQRGLASAVGTDEAEAVGITDAEVDPGEEGLRAEGLADLVGGDEC